ncbi:high mobility group B protein 9-like [Euphorbia lathyris]|uniref:high mobility group B protein 9-like n=1 Tax=Euphorbia lathyris TaxID=212925 RepID=UPI003313890C
MSKLSSAPKVTNGGIVANERYPPPLSSHEQIVNDPTSFWDTLRTFHSTMGTKFRIPVMGHQKLDLHVLYVEATKRGGYQKVVAEKKWKEIGCVVNFSPTITKVSFALRKHYFSLLYHYEQVYYLKTQGILHFVCAVGTIDGKFDFGYLVSVQVGSEVLSGVLYHQPENDENGEEDATCGACAGAEPAQDVGWGERSPPGHQLRP